MTTTTRSPLLAPDEQPPQPAHRGAGRTLASWCAAHRWRTLLAGLLVLAGAVLLLGGGTTNTKSLDQLVGDSALAEKARAAADFGEKPTENVVLSTRSGRFDAAAVAALGTEFSRAYQGVPGVAGVGRMVPAQDGRTLLLPVALAAANPGPDGSTPAGAKDPSDVVGPMLAVTQKLADAHPQLRVGQVGPGSIDNEIGKAMDADFQRAELISLPVTLAVLLVAFGAVVAAGVPVLLGIGAVMVALGLTAFASNHIVPVDQNTSSMVLLVGLAVGVDYALFVIRRAREERAAGATVRESVQRAGATAGRAVLISGITVVVAMSGMLVAGGMFTSLAIGAMLVVGVAVLASATVLPAILSVLGDKVEAIRLPGTRRRAARRTSIDNRWGKLAGQVIRRPLLWTLGAGLVLVALAIPALGMRTSLMGAESMPDSFKTVEAYHRMTAAFPQDGTTVDLVVSAPASASGQVAAALRDAYPVATRGGQVVGPLPELKVAADRTVTVLELAVPHTGSDPATGKAVDGIRADVVPAVQRSLAAVPGVQVHVGGAAADADLSAWMDERLPWVVGFVLVLTLIVMLISFGSPALALATVALNVLSVGAAYGVMTLIFQGTWAEGLLDFHSVGSIASWLPLLMFVILFGLSMDYHVFVLSRVREAWLGGAEPRQAVRIGVARSAGVVTSAAAVMVAVFAIFATLSSLEMKQLGIGLATAVLLDATLVRGILLPAVLALLGKKAHTGPKWIPVLHH